MVVIAHQVGVDAVRAEDGRHRVIERLQWPPSTVEEVVTTRVQFAPRRHARHAAHVTGVEAGGLFRQPREIRCSHPVAAIRLQHAPVQRIEHHHDGFHWFTPLPDHRRRQS